MATAKKSKAKLRGDNSTGYHGVTKLANGKFVGQSYFAGKTHRTSQYGKAIDAAKAFDELVTQAQKDGLLKRVKFNFPS